MFIYTCMLLFPNICCVVFSFSQRFYFSAGSCERKLETLLELKAKILKSLLLYCVISDSVGFRQKNSPFLVLYVELICKCFQL